MIKFIVTTERGRKLLGIGLEKLNIEKLQFKLPIHFFLSELTIDNRIDEVFIFYGDTQEEMYESLKEKGYIDEETKIIRKEKNKAN